MYLTILEQAVFDFFRTFDFSYQYWKVLLNKSLGFQRFTSAGYSFDVSNVNNIIYVISKPHIQIYVKCVIKPLFSLKKKKGISFKVQHNNGIT